MPLKPTHPPPPLPKGGPTAGTPRCRRLPAPSAGERSDGGGRDREERGGRGVPALCLGPPFPMKPPENFPRGRAQTFSAGKVAGRARGGGPDLLREGPRGGTARDGDARGVGGHRGSAPCAPCPEFGEFPGVWTGQREGARVGSPMFAGAERSGAVRAAGTGGDSGLLPHQAGPAPPAVPEHSGVSRCGTPRCSVRAP